jgi:hypothetical protein
MTGWMGMTHVPQVKRPSPEDIVSSLFALVNQFKCRGCCERMVVIQDHNCRGYTWQRNYDDGYEDTVQETSANDFTLASGCYFAKLGDEKIFDDILWELEKLRFYYGVEVHTTEERRAMSKEIAMIRKIWLENCDTVVARIVDIKDYNFSKIIHLKDVKDINRWLVGQTEKKVKVILDKWAGRRSRISDLSSLVAKFLPSRWVFLDERSDEDRFGFSVHKSTGIRDTLLFTARGMRLLPKRAKLVLNS